MADWNSDLVKASKFELYVLNKMIQSAVLILVGLCL